MKTVSPVSVESRVSSAKIGIKTKRGRVAASSRRKGILQTAENGVNRLWGIAIEAGKIQPLAVVAHKVKWRHKWSRTRSFRGDVSVSHQVRKHHS